jgi:hypothetical protein
MGDLTLNTFQLSPPVDSDESCSAGVGGLTASPPYLGYTGRLFRYCDLQAPPAELIVKSNKITVYSISCKGQFDFIDY